MPYLSKEWQSARYRGQTLTGIKQHKEDETKFLFSISMKGARKKKIITITGAESERYPAAIREYSQMRADIYEGYYIDPVTFDEMFNRWMLPRQRTQWTLQQRGVYDNHIAPHLAALNLQDIKPRHIDTVMIQVKGKADATRKGVIGIIKAVLILALDEKIIKSLPIEKRHRVKVSAATQKTLILDAGSTYQRVYRSIMELFADSPQFRAIFLFGLNGRRKSEILSLEWEYINLNTGAYIIKAAHSKVRQDLSFTLPGDVLAALQEIRPDDPAGLVFPNPNTGKAYTNIRRQVQAIRDHSGYKDFGFHRMRNLTASALFGAGVDASHLSSLLGHTSPETLKQYLTMQREKACEIVEISADKLLNKIDEETKVHSVEYRGKGITNAKA